jgi:hypothetical protein
MSTLNEFFGRELPRLPALPKRATFISVSADKVVIETGRLSKVYYGTEAKAVADALDKGTYWPQLPGRSRNGTTVLRR